MPLSPRFEELMNGLELKDALWHLQRANSGENQASEAEIILGYSRVLQLAQNTGGCVGQILQETTQELGGMPSRESLLKNRDIHVRESWNREGDQNYHNTVRDLTKHVHLSKLVKQAQKLQEWKGVQIGDIEDSVKLLPDMITQGEQTITLNKEKILKTLGLADGQSEEISHAEAA